MSNQDNLCRMSLGRDRSLDDTSTRLNEENDPSGSFTSHLHSLFEAVLAKRYDMRRVIDVITLSRRRQDVIIRLSFPCFSARFSARSHQAPRHLEQNGICEANWRNLAFAYIMNDAHVDMSFFLLALEHAWKVLAMTTSMCTVEERSMTWTPYAICLNALDISHDG
jgi:hypothetical protein